jgi:hypothetical protein
MSEDKGEAAAALGRFFAEARRNQPPVTWHAESTKLMQCDSPVEYRGKSYSPGELINGVDSTRACLLVRQRLAHLVYIAQVNTRTGEVTPRETLPRPPASFEGMSIDMGTVEVFYPDRGPSFTLPVFRTWPDLFGEEQIELRPGGWDFFLRCSILKDTDTLRELVPLPTFWRPGLSYEFFLNHPTLHKVGYVIEGFPEFGNPETAAVSVFNPQIPE